MARGNRRRRFAARTRTVYRTARSKARRPKRNDLKRYAKKAAFGTAAGLVVSVPLTLIGKKIGQPILIEAGQRIGSVAASAAGGPIGVTGYQTADAIFDRFLVGNGNMPSFSGTQGQAYL